MSTDHGAPSRRWLLAGLAVAALAAAGAAAWLLGGDDADDVVAGEHPGAQLLRNPLPDPEATGVHGVVLDEPIPRPAFALTDTDGAAYDFAAETAGRPTLLYVGYTSCPDICPLHLADIAGAMEELGWDGDEVEVVFVTADPERDDPETLRAYLDAFHESFVGLTGEPDEIDAALAELGQPPVERFNERGDTYEVTHPSQVIAFDADDEARVAFPAGTGRDGWLADLPRLLEGEIPPS